MDIRVNLDFIGYKVTPLDYQGMWSLTNMTNYCHSLGFVQDVLDIELRLELFVNECFFGPFGYLNDNPEDPFDCWRRRYYPNIPVWSTSFMDEWDRRSEY